MEEDQFNNGILIDADDLPDHYLQEIKDLTAVLLTHAFYDSEKGAERDRNMGLAALERALGLTIARLFTKDCVMDITKIACESLIKSVQEWSQND